MGLSMTAILTDTVTYRIAGYFRGVLIFGIFMVHPGVTNFSTHEIFHTLCKAVYMCSNLDRRCFVLALFHYLGPDIACMRKQCVPGLSLGGGGGGGGGVAWGQGYIGCK